MALKLVSRNAWGARSPRAATSYLSSTRGVKVHYTGDYMDPRIADDHSRCAPRVRSIQNGHMDGNGWNDIGYSAVVCPHAHVFVGRGPNRLPSANGPGLNTGHYAVCGLVGNSGLTKPTNAMLHGIRDAIGWLRDEGAAGGEIKGHRDGYATDCPGAALYAWVRQGAPRPSGNSEEEDMPEYVSVGVSADIPLPPSEWVTIYWDKEYSDSEGQHGNSGGPTVLNGKARYSLTAALSIKGLPPGTEGQIRAIEVDDDDTSKFDAGPLQEFLGSNGSTKVLYALPADTVNKGKRLRVQVIQYGSTPATVTDGSAKVLFWR